MNPPAIYFPIKDKRYSTRAGLTKLGHDFGNQRQDQKLFQFDTQFSDYRHNKLKALEYSMYDYVCADAASPAITGFIQQQLCEEHPDYFSRQGEILHCQLTNEKHSINAKSFFNFLALQVQEDICVMRISESNTTLVAAHLCAANHWSAREKLGMDMLALHQHVPAFSDENKQPNQLMAGLHNKQQAYVRFAWGLNKQPILNQHPNFKPDNALPATEKVWLRIERQVLYPVADTDLMLFTIRTYFRDCADLAKQQRISLISAIESMTDETLKYKNINKTDVVNKLERQTTGCLD